MLSANWRIGIVIFDSTEKAAFQAIIALAGMTRLNLILHFATQNNLIEKWFVNTSNAVNGIPQYGYRKMVY